MFDGPLSAVGGPSRSPGGAGALLGPPGAPQSQHWLRQREEAVLAEMINMAVPLDARGNPVSEPYSTAAANAAEPVVTTWRLLIFDDWGRDIIAPLLKVGQLRELGVTLYLHIATERDPVPGAPAIYFCAPTEENIARIADDCAHSLYEWVYLNFTTQIPRPQLESLSQKLCSSPLQSIRHIRVFDRTLSYVALENDLFSLMLNNSFVVLNKTNAKDEEIEEHLNQVVLGISHVCLSMQVLPILVHSRSGAATEVARRLSLRLNDALNDKQLTPAPSSVLGRPLLLLVDRSSDIATALHHPFTYRGLLVELGGMRLNKCAITTSDGKDEVLEVDPDKDEVYVENAGLDFGAVGGNIEAALRRYKEEYAALAQETPGGIGDDGGDGNDMSKLLANAPGLAERKRCLDAHTKLAFNILNKIRARHLDHYHGVELAVLQQEGFDAEEFHSLLSNGMGTPEDLQRLFLIAYLMCTEGDDAQVVQEHESAFGDAAAFPALAYLKHLRNWSLTTQSPSASQPNASQGFGWGFAQQLAKNIASSLGTKSETMLPLTKLVDALMQDGPGGAGGSGSPVPYGSPVGGGGVGALPAGSSGGGSSSVLRAKLLETVEAYDPRTKKPVDLREAVFSQAIVFALGGGSVAEYDNLKAWEARKQRKSVMYGCTSVVSGEDMLRQLAVLGATQKS
ncbi:putative mitochondrial sec1 family transport protein [Leptomonas pyrrhocoris]|uniref:Putative mitochondrial sec1 family transport protein n=1 Tax=Leptomonas pyrrhocoris TaxID=157538 RepID=A0A0M9FQS3_LEPPY|nr:putative mitochondrial sec1 family transport protein [Leptomonas pyrrhocoris]KPA74093.1 putative mitochondrial sec1 family transport protein [Leptomonas pyrrhocoris]|eukprot:XP_015652532.1 putative mitochondrial sec1 family transport protein [Leptomonas pyrrhocoris]